MSTAHSNLQPRRDAQVEYLASQEAKCFQGLAVPVAGACPTDEARGSQPLPPRASSPPGTRTKFAEPRVARGPGASGVPYTSYRASRQQWWLSGQCCYTAHDFCPPASRASRSLRAAALFRARSRGEDAREFRALRVRAVARAGRPGPGACSPGRARRHSTGAMSSNPASGLAFEGSVQMPRGNCRKTRDKRCECLSE